MTTTATGLDQPTLVITETIRVEAALDRTFEALIVQMGPSNETPEGQALPMILEPRPGGRWYRDLGGDNGHLWGFVQSIKRPTLLEIWGPLFISTGATSNLIYRLAAEDGGTTIRFQHSLVGPVPDEMGEHMAPGWSVLHQRVKRVAEAVRR